MRPLRDLALAGAALLVLYGMQQTQPDYAEITGPYTSHGAKGDVVATDAFEVELIGYKAAQRLLVGRDRKQLTTDGIWVVAAVKARARRQSLSIASATWVGAGGVRYHESDRTSSLSPVLSSRRIEPGQDIEGIAIFEIPRRELDGATLHLARNRVAPLSGEAAITMPDFGSDRVVEELDLNF